jgi:Methyltransferase FkbM domain
LVVELRLPRTQRWLQPIAFADLIRLGRNNDGGYVVPSSVIKEADGLLALGVFDDWSFECAAQELNPSLIIDAYDHTISRKRFSREFWIDVLRVAKRRTTVAAALRHLQILRSYNAFFRDRNRHFAQKITNRPASEKEINVTTALDRLGRRRVFIKMDIEGNEYRVFNELVTNSSRIVGACVEFHDIGPLRPVFDKAIKTLLSHFVIAHVHPNNYGQIAEDGLPDILEITFVNRRLVDENRRRSNIYVPELDQPNDPERPDLAFTA